MEAFFGGCCEFRFERFRRIEIHRTLLYYLHLTEQITGTGKFVDNKQCITDIKRNIPANFGIEHDVAHGAFPATIEVYANQFTITKRPRTISVVSKKR